MTILRRVENGERVGEALVSDLHCYIDMIEVVPGCRRRGVGTELLRMAERHLASCGCSQVTLLSLPDARGFYEKNGYVAKWWAPNHFRKALPDCVGNEKKPKTHGVWWACWRHDSDVLDRVI